MSFWFSGSYRQFWMKFNLANSLIWKPIWIVPKVNQFSNWFVVHRYNFIHLYQYNLFVRWTENSKFYINFIEGVGHVRRFLRQSSRSKTHPDRLRFWRPPVPKRLSSLWICWGNAIINMTFRTGRITNTSPIRCLFGVFFRSAMTMSWSGWSQSPWNSPRSSGSLTWTVRGRPFRPTGRPKMLPN